MYPIKSQLAINFVFLLLKSIKCQDIQYEYTIEIPKRICDKKEDLKAGVTTIRLLGKDAQRLQYEFSVNFSSMNNCDQSQRCTLMAWRAVRNLEKYLHTFQRGFQEININNSMLEPGLQYVLNVAVTNDGVPVGNKEFLFELECTLNSTLMDNTTPITITGNTTPTSSTIIANTTTNTTTASTTTTNTTTTNTTTTNTTTTNTTTTNTTATSNTTMISAASNGTATNGTATNGTTTNSSMMHSEENSHVSLVLLGSNVTYRDMTYILNAEATDCDVNCSYYFKWEILDNSENFVTKEPTKGSELHISFESLMGMEQYIIRCSLMSTPKNALIATALQNITVLNRGLFLKLAVASLEVGMKQPFKLSAYFQDPDNSNGTTKIDWLCKRENQGSCSNFKTINSTSFERNGFITAGRYNITITVTKGSTTKQDSCEVRVVEKGFARIDVDNIDEPIDPSKDIEVPVYVSQLVASCTLQWMSVKTASYTDLNLQVIPGNINAITNITLKEDEFLNEIDEFSNNTVDIDYNLKLPPPRGSWKGLQGNSSYLFRLNVTCPVAEAENDNDEDSEPLQKYVTLYADVTLHTDSSPILNSLEVTPKQGVALKTLFKFMYQSNESSVDFPVLYKFGFLLNNEIIFVANLLGVTNTKSVLPYINKGVKTVLEGCNSYSLCAQIFGPVILTNVPLVSEDDQKNLKRQLRELMNREEYYKVFTYSLSILQSYNNSNNENTSKSIQNFISNLTSSEIKRLLMQSADGDPNWRAPANELIKNIGVLLNNFSASDILLNNVIALRNELSRKNSLKLSSERFVSRKLLMVNNNKGRFKREIEKMALEEVKSYLVISELIITTSPDRKRVRQEKLNLLSQVEKFMPGLCAGLYEKSQTTNLELKTLILSMEKINKNTFNRYVHILYPQNTWKVEGRIKLGKCYTEQLKSNNKLCLGKIAFKNYLDKKGFVHLLKIYSAEETNDQLEYEEVVCDSVLVLPVDEKQLRGKEARCALWKNRWLQSHCKTLQETAKTIQCSCNYLGYYSLEYVTPVPTTAAPIITESTTTLATAAVEAGVNTETEANTTIADLVVLPTEETSTALTSTGASVTSSAITSVATTAVTNSITAEVASGDSQTEGQTEETATQLLEVSSTVQELPSNISLASFHVPAGEDVTVFYFIIGFSIAGIGILLYGIKHLLSKQEEVLTDDFPKYALLHHQEMLQDLPDSTQ